MIGRRPIEVLAFIDYYRPGIRGGGSVTSLVALVELLRSDVAFRVMTRNHDQGVSDAYPDARTGDWCARGNATVMYCEPGMLWPWTVSQVLIRSHPAVVYLNSFFSPQFSLVPLLVALACRAGIRGCSPRVLIAPRGEFSPGALKISRLKKRIYIAFFRFLRLHRRVSWHASNSLEKSEIDAALGKDVLVYEAPDAWIDFDGRPASIDLRPVKVQGHLEAIFISRVSPKKNLSLVLDALRFVTGAVRLRIFGPLEDPDYWRRCRELLTRLPSNVSVDYCGALAPQEVGARFATAHLFIFPTAGENFGHVVRESLHAGCPVLISDRTPWNDLQESGAGWVCGLEAPQVAAGIQAAVDQDSHSWQRMSESALRYVESKCSPADVRKLNLALFEVVTALPEVSSGRSE